MYINARSAASELVAENLEKPLLDDRIYRVVRLPNKLEVLIIHDPETDKASAAMDVRAGSLSDAPKLPGMAHAVEHMLFLGNEKYSLENDYTSYLSKYNGSHNAFTAQQSTNYFFEMSVDSAGPADAGAAVEPASELLKPPKPFYGALDRFANFFVKPLFLAESLDRELRAVDSEHKKNLQSDVWRLQQLKRSLSNPAHPNSNFSTGNLKTLRDDPVARGITVRDEFIQFYNVHYSANRMKLVILGRESLDELQSWAEELFSTVPNKDLQPNRWDTPLLTMDELLTETFVTPVTEKRTLDITFPYPDEDLLWESHPGRYISHLVGHEGIGSAMAALKTRGWADGLSAGARTICGGSGIFEISVDLTPEGLKSYQQVVVLLFQYLSILTEAPPQRWIFEESRNLAEVAFRFQQKRAASSTASSMAGIMQTPLPREHLLDGPATMRKFDSDAIVAGIKALNPDNFKVTVVSKEPLPGEVLREKWYGTEYSTRKISTEFLAAVRAAAICTASARPSDLYLPGKNEFVPSRLDVDKKEVKKPATRPTLVRNDDAVRLWFKKDDRFWVPKATFHVRLRSPVCGSSARNWLMASLYTDLVTDALEQYSYDADLAGLGSNFFAWAHGFGFAVSGYNDKMAVLLEKVLTTARNHEVDDARFDIIKERMDRHLRNKGYGAPYQQIGEYTRWLTSDDGHYIPEQHLADLPDITAQDLRNFKSLMFSQLHAEAFAHGNLYLEDALKMADLTLKTLAARSLPSSQRTITRSLIVPEGTNSIWERMLPDPANVNHAIDYSLQICEATDREARSRLLMLDQIIHEPAFDRLRTKEQLGYVVFSGSTRAATMLGFHFLIQSERAPDYLEQRVDAFLRAFSEELRSMDGDKFEAHRRSKIGERLEKPKNLGAESSRYIRHIGNEVYFFDESDDDAVRLQRVTLAEIVEFFDRHVHPDSRHRRKVSVHLRAKCTPSAVDMSDTKLATKIDEHVKIVAEQALNKLNLISDKQHLSKTTSEAQHAEDAVPPPAILPVRIEDARGFKASLTLSIGAMPCRPLEDFEKDPACKL